MPASAKAPGGGIRAMPHLQPRQKTIEIHSSATPDGVARRGSGNPGRKRMRLRILIAAAAGLLALGDIASAQTTPAASSRTRTPAAQTPATGAAASTTTTTRRTRSPAQLRNDQIMRDCGAEWRTNKTALQAAGKTWRTFLPECRARRVRT